MGSRATQLAASDALLDRLRKNLCHDRLTLVLSMDRLESFDHWPSYFGQGQFVVVVYSRQLDLPGNLGRDRLGERLALEDFRLRATNHDAVPQTHAVASIPHTHV